VIRYEELLDFRLESKLVFKQNCYLLTAYELRLAVEDGSGSLAWPGLCWSEDDVLRGEAVLEHTPLVEVRRRRYSGDFSSLLFDASR
jgi:hypothetical protein